MLHRNKTGKGRKGLGIWLLILCLCSGFGMEAAAGQLLAGSGLLTEAALAKTGSQGQTGIALLKSKKKKKNKNKNNNNSNNNNSNSNNNNSSNNSNSNNSNSSNSSNSNQNSAGSKDTGSNAQEQDQAANTGDSLDDIQVEKNGSYTSKMEVAAYIHQFGELPGNFITKNEAKDLGWVNSKGNLDEVAPGKSIGGDYFGNYEELLPVKKGRKYYECDIDYTGGYRASKRIIYSNDGYIFYTEDHYTTFEQLYPYE